MNSQKNPNKQFILLPINNLLDSFFIAGVRNEGRHNMTNDVSRISLLRQVNWYYSIYKKDNAKGILTCYIFKKDSKGIGYALIKKVKNKYWITGGIKASFRGLGYGNMLFQLIIAKVPSDEVWLEVLDTNKVAFKIYKKIGFKIVSRSNNSIIIMKLKKHNNEKLSKSYI